MFGDFFAQRKRLQEHMRKMREHIWLLDNALRQEMRFVSFTHQETGKLVCSNMDFDLHEAGAFSSCLRCLTYKRIRDVLRQKAP